MTAHTLLYDIAMKLSSGQNLTPGDMLYDQIREYLSSSDKCLCWTECPLLGKPECERVDPEKKVMCLKYEAQKTIDEGAYTMAIINWLDDNEISHSMRCADITELVQILKNIDSDRPIQGMESSSIKPDQKE